MLRDYQIDGVEKLRRLYAAKKKAPLYTLPTGGGKTVVFSHITQKMAEKQKSICILVHRQELLHQASRNLRELGIHHALIAPGFRYKGEPVAVASVQTLRQRMKKEQFHFDLLVIDEAHHAVAGTWKKVIEGMPRARLLGVTATPTRSDGKGLGEAAGGCFDSMVIGPPVRWLIQNGYLCRPAVFTPPVQFSLEGIRTSGGDYNAKELAEVVDKPKIIGSAVAHYARLCPLQPAIAFCASVAHAEHTAAEFAAAGFVAKSIDGTMSDGERKGLINGLKAGDIHVLTSCDIISEGTDIPRVSAAILLRPTQSEGLFLQQVGRALRPVYAEGFDLSKAEGRLAAIAASDKPRALILDHVGNIGMATPRGFVLKHGFPDDEREWSLSGRPKRKRGKQAERISPLKKCGNCYHDHEPAPRCPMCGFEYPVTGREIEQVAGELKELTPEEVERLRAKRWKENRTAQSLDELIALGKARGYKNPVFWAKKYFESKQQRSRA